MALGFSFGPQVFWQFHVSPGTYQKHNKQHQEVRWWEVLLYVTLGDIVIIPQRLKAWKTWGMVSLFEPPINGCVLFVLIVSVNRWDKKHNFKVGYTKFPLAFWAENLRISHRKKGTCQLLHSDLVWKHQWSLKRAYISDLHSGSQSGSLWRSWCNLVYIWFIIIFKGNCIPSLKLT